MLRNILKIFFICLFLYPIFSGCARYEDDVTFARKTMEQLIEGSYSARTRIDWPIFKVMGRDVGRQYEQYKTDKEKIDYERSFIKAFSDSYKGKGAKASAFFGWRPSEHKFENVGYNVVAAYCYDETKTFLFFISEEKKHKKIVEILAFQTNFGQKP